MRPKIPVVLSPHVLRPFDRREVMTVAEAAEIIGQSEANVRRLVGRYDLGRKVGGGAYSVSRVAWRLFIDGDGEGLRAYHEGRRQHPSVRALYSDLGMA